MAEKKECYYDIWCVSRDNQKRDKNVRFEKNCHNVLFHYIQTIQYVK